MAKTYPRIDKIEPLTNYFIILKSDLIEDYSTHKDILSGTAIDFFTPS